MNLHFLAVQMELIKQERVGRKKIDEKEREREKEEKKEGREGPLSALYRHRPLTRSPVNPTPRPG